MSTEAIDVTGVYAAARNVKPHLRRLVGAREADAVAASLDDVLREFDPPNEAGAARITDLLNSRRGTARHLAEVLSDPPRYRPARDRGQKNEPRGGPIDDPGWIPAVSTWKCTFCSWTWPRADAADPVPAVCEQCNNPGLIRLP
ncbi:hypothetical protein [Streptomyces sp. NPDC094468]|uniref:hypothetical protein n=1 Tax=Streptomyces sp. NPDC094468 TaxID=3366066 RepID=UPI003807E879